MTALPALFAFCWLAAAPTKAPSAEETRLFDEGMRAFQAGDARAADKAWRAGYALGKDPAFLVRMGEAEEKAGQASEAVDSYRRYLRAAPDAADRSEIEQRIARLAPAGEAAPTTTPGAAPPAAAASETPGSFEAPGATPTPTAPATAPAAARARDEETARPVDEADERGWTPYNVTAWAASGATVLLLGVAAFYAASAGSEKDDVNVLLRFQDPSTGAPLEYQNVAARYESAVKSGQRDDRLAKDMLYLAAGTAAVATAFFIIDSALAPEGARAARDRARAPDAPHLGLMVAPAPVGGGRASGLAALSSLRWSF